MYEKATAIFIEKISNYVQLGSDWVFNEIAFLDINFSPFNPIRARSYFKLPDELTKKKAIINVKNINENECFKWIVTSAVYSPVKDPQRLTKTMIENSKKFVWNDLNFPVSLKQIDKFEKQNKFAINVSDIIKKYTHYE